MSFCAYCGKAAVMTREHIWAESLIKKYEDLLTYNRSQHKFYKGDPVVRDVCDKCNNVVLGRLDEYFSGLFDREFRRFLKPGETVSFDYDYDLLLRTLLKISYNAARSVKNEKAVKHHKKFVQYMLEGTHRGSVMLRLQIVTSSKMIDVEGNDHGFLNPEILRCGGIPYDGVLSDRFMIRMVAINCFWFYIISPYRSEPAHKWKAFIQDFVRREGMMQPGVVVDSVSSRIVIPPNKTTYYHPDLYRDLQSAHGQKSFPDLL
ncbi:hypothetical protein ACW9I5_06005 [Pseudomonas azotoformans]